MLIARAKCLGAATYPKRHPVMAKDLENPFTTIVRSHIPSIAAIE